MENNQKIDDFLSEEKIPFMHYGIINRYNYSQDNLYNVPVKRWDPLAFNYEVNPKYAIYSYITGHYSYISPVRSARPSDRKADIEPVDPPELIGRIPPINWNSETPIDLFEPMLNGKHYIINDSSQMAYSIILNDGTKQLDSPFSNKPRVYSNLTENAITMINKFPAMARVVDSEIQAKLAESLYQEDPNGKLAFGICTVTIPKKYYTRLQDMTGDDLTDLFLALQTAIRLCIRASIEEKGIHSIPISPFFNIGKLVGGSMRRIHSQVYFDLSQDGHGSRMELMLKTFAKMSEHHKCHLCHSGHGHQNRTILENDYWVIFATGSPVRNYHLRFSPRSHIPHIGQISKIEFQALADLLRIIFKAMDVLGVNPNRNLILNTRPYGYDNDFHFFGDILPHEFIGGAEMADDMRVVRLSPLTVANQFRSVIKEQKMID